MSQKVLVVVLLGACCGLALATIALNDDTGQDAFADTNHGSLITSELQQSSSSSDGKSKLTLWPLDWVDLAMAIIIGVCLSLAGGAGIGGGAILVPIYIMLRGWPTNIAVAMSNVTVLGGSFANFVCNVNRHRPNGARTIDWELILMMEPTTIAGALFGAMLNKLLPNYITTYLLTVMLTFMGLRLYQKGREAYAKETKLFKAAKHAAKAAARHALDEQEHQGASDAVNTPTSAIRTQNSVSTPKGIARSLSRTVSRSISRLSGPMILQVSNVAREGSSPRQASFTRAQLHAAVANRASFNNRHGSTLRFAQTEGSAEAAAAAAAATAGDDAGNAGAAWLPQVLSADAHRQIVDAFDVSTLCQGDIVGDTIEPIIVLPSNATFSSASEDSSHASSDDSADDDPRFDVEAGTSLDDLSRPLLVSAAAPAGDVNDAGVLLNDVASGRRDVADTGIPGKDWPAGDLATAATAKPAVPEPCVPVPHLLTLLALSAWVIASDTLQHSMICGSWQYWVVTLSVLAPVVLILMVFRQVLLRKYNHDGLAPGTVLPEGQLHWTRKTTLLYPILCSSAGLIAGLFGIGGGVVKGPLMLELGVPADVAAATSATMIMFTAGSACVVYSRFGQILLDYGAVLAVFGFCTTLGSQLLTFVLIRLLGRRSVIVFMMVTLMSIACAIMYIQSVFETQEIIQHPEELTRFGHLCPAAGEGVGYVLNQLLFMREA